MRCKATQIMPCRAIHEIFNFKSCKLSLQILKQAYHVCDEIKFLGRKQIMAMTMTQKILAAKAGLEKVEAGQLILVNLDRV